MSAPPADDHETLLRLQTTVWGPFGTNGLAGDVKGLRTEVGKLYERDEALERETDRRLAAIRDEARDERDEIRESVNEKLDGLYKLVATLIVSILVGAAGIIVTILVVVPPK